jgi:hypothetical protein
MLSCSLLRNLLPATSDAASESLAVSVANLLFPFVLVLNSMISIVVIKGFTSA